MRSVLTRLVFRRILHNEPILHRDCVYRPAQLVLQYRRRLPSFSQRRTLFGFSRPAARAPRKGDPDPGLDIIINASKNLETRTRVPPPAELASSWSSFFAAKCEREERISDIHVGHAYRVYLHLRELPVDVPLLSTKDLLSALKALTSADQLEMVKISRESYLDFVRELYSKVEPHSEELHLGSRELEVMMVTSLAYLGHCPEAVDLFLSVVDTSRAAHVMFRRLTSACKNENNVEDLERMIQGISQAGHGKEFQLAASCTFAELGLMARAKSLANLEELEKRARNAPPLADTIQPSEDALSVSRAMNSLLSACLAYNDLEWGQELIRVVTEAGFLSKHRRIWDLLFVWALGTGKSVEDVHRMMGVMVRTVPSFTPDSSTINRLIKFANGKNDPYMSERLLALGDKWNVKPNANTFMLQMDYRLSTGDLEGARAAYRQLQGQEQNGDDDLPRINKLIQAMISSGKYHFNAIIEIVEELSTRNHRFDPETVAALSILHLRRDEYHDVADLLTSHVHQYTTEERAIVRDTFVNFCLDRKNSIARVWDTYMIFQQVFDESDREVRTRIMNEFFTRRRPDMAIHVFNHMRKHTRLDTIPTIDTYAAALVGIGKTKDRESLTVVHNALKLDMNVDPCTKLNNALLIAYAGCGEPRYAINFWHDIANSKEGPNYNSILALFNACEKAAFEEKRAYDVWNKLEQLDVVMTRDLVAKYLAALAGNQCYEEAQKIAEECEEMFGFPADATM
jgi:hypothetical protein